MTASPRRLTTRFAVLAGALLVGWLLLGGRTKEVVLVYDLAGAPGATALEVELHRGAATVRRAEFRFAHGAPPQVRHPVKLPEGEYAVAFTVHRPEGDVRGERAVSVSEDGAIVLPLGP